MKPTININIDKLIENFTVVGQTAESKETIKQVITEVLLTAVNDVNLGELEVKNDSIANNAEPISANEKTTKTEKALEIENFYNTLYFRGIILNKKTLRKYGFSTREVFLYTELSRLRV